MCLNFQNDSPMSLAAGPGCSEALLCIIGVGESHCNGVRLRKSIQEEYWSKEQGTLASVSSSLCRKHS